MTERSIDRRGFVAIGAAGAAGFACAPLLGGAAHADEVGEASTAARSYLDKPDPVSPEDIVETRDYDVVVVGAGASGMAAALSAHKSGASVAVVQKESVPMSQGSSCAGIDLDLSSEDAIQNYVSKIMGASEYRAHRELVSLWAHRSGEAIKYVIDYSQPGSCPIYVDTESDIEVEGAQGVVHYFVARPGVKPIMWYEGVNGLAELAANDGVDIYCSTPGEQLVQDESGRVTGVVCSTADGYVQFNAARGVVLATGDYQNDPEMVHDFCPDVEGFDMKQSGKTGDGHKMAMWVGGQMEPVGHTKMVHDMDSGPMSTSSLPLLYVDMAGNRFCDEGSAGMMVINNIMRGWDKPGHYCQIFDSALPEKIESWGGRPVKLESLASYIPEEDIEERTGVIAGLIDTHKADTLEELAEMLEISDVDNFLATVEHYNQLCAQGSDPEFGKLAKYLTPIDTPPYYGTHRHVRVSAILSGVVVDATLHVTDAEGSPIPGLFAAGNTAGGFYGGVDYPGGFAGLSVGRAVTFGYVAGENAANEA